jgi:small subunit ribosomal protein S2
MEQFTTKPRPDGLHLLDYSKTLHRIDVAGKFIAFVGPQNVVVYTSRDYGKVPVEKFCEVTKAIPVVGRFMPGTLTNPLFPGHLDVELIVVADPASDTQAIVEGGKMGTPVIAVCDTDNITDDIDLVIPGNNRGRRSLATIFYLLARSVLTHSSLLTGDQQLKYTIDDFETKVTESDMEEQEEERPRRHDRY